MGRSEKAYRQFHGKVQPGDRLYAVITCATPNLFLGCYMPRPYFVLEVVVMGEHNLSTGSHYEIDCNFHLDSTALFLEVEDAKKALTNIFTAETDGILTRDKVRLVTSQEYKEASAKHEARRLSRVA